MEGRLRQALLRAEEVGKALADPLVARDPAQLKSLGREHTRLAPVVRLAERLARLEHELAQARELADEADPELAALARADLARLPPEIAAVTEELHELLLPRDPHDDRDAIVEIRAGTGGDEAALFAADLYRMYQRFSERHGLSWEPISLSDGTLGGLKEAIVAVRGRRRLRPAAPGVGRAPGAARAGDRDPGTHPHLRRDRGRAARGRGGGREDRGQGPPDRRVPLLRPRRPEREHDRQRGAHHPPARPASWSASRTRNPSCRTSSRRWRCCARACSTG